jgi:hypothetical protein
MREFMKLYDNDFSILSEKDKVTWEELQEQEIVHQFGGMTVRRSKYREYPVGVRHYLGLFPNNHLDINDLQKEEELNFQTDKFLETILTPEANERTLLNFIRDHGAYFIIASLFKGYYTFGHHGAYVFPEFQIGNSFKADFLLIGKSSGGYEFVFIELEHPNKKITLADGSLGEAIRKGLNQVSDWQSWLEENFSSLTETFDKYRHPEKPLPREFMKFDSSRIHYAVIAGRREHFNEKTYKLRRRYLDNRINILHYENLYDSAKRLIGALTY